MNMVELANLLGWTSAGIAFAGAVYAVAAALLAGRFMRAARPEPRQFPAVTILKPLHGSEPGLAQNLETFFVQDYPGELQIVFGVHDHADPAIAVVQALQARYPERDTMIVAETALYGSNGKISNLINMVPAARHDTLVLSDSDIAAPPHWLRQVTGALDRPGVGVVTCLYTGEPRHGKNPLWSSLAAMGTSYDFLPNVMMGASLGLASPCFGSTIALRRATLDEIGGFQAFSNLLADDYEIGRAARAKGYTLAIPALGVGHAANEATARELFRHELRWTRTIRLVSPSGHLGSFVTFGFAFALIAALLTGFSTVSLWALGLALAARLFLKYRIDGIFGTHAGPYWLMPVRDLLSFTVFVTSLFGETVHWRSTRFDVAPSGAMSQS